MKRLFALLAIVGMSFAQIGCGAAATEDEAPATPETTAPADPGDAAPADDTAEAPEEDTAE